jgi:hypothetical protein
MARVTVRCGVWVWLQRTTNNSPSSPKSALAMVRYHIRFMAVLGFGEICGYLRGLNTRIEPTVNTYFYGILLANPLPIRPEIMRIGWLKCLIGCIWGLSCINVQQAGAQVLTPAAHWATDVYAFAFGSLQTVGQQPQFFPANVLGPLPEGTNGDVQNADPADVCSLGRDGWIVLGFGADVLDGPGPDFIVFENAFYIRGTDSAVFDEWMIVEVSPDGDVWYTFAHDTLSGEGMAGRTPPGNWGVDYADPSQSGGDAFDLADLGLPRVRYIRLRDATRYQNDGLRLAADLDAVLVRYLEPSARADNQSSRARVWVSQTSGHPTLHAEPAFRALHVWDAAGRLLVDYSTTPAQTAIALPQGAAGVLIWQGLTDNGQLLSGRLWCAD